MTSRDFAFFLQGYFEISDPKEIGPDETEMIKRHLNLVFKHEIDPSMGDEKHQQVLNEIHSGNGTAGPSTIFPLNNNPNDGVLRC
jgi:hypothetical protein